MIVLKKKRTHLHFNYEEPMGIDITEIGFKYRDALEANTSPIDKYGIHQRLENLGVALTYTTEEREKDGHFDIEGSVFCFHEFPTKGKYIMLRAHQEQDIKKHADQKPASYFYNILDFYESGKRLHRIIDNSYSATNTVLDNQIKLLTLESTENG